MTALIHGLPVLMVLALLAGLPAQEPRGPSTAGPETFHLKAVATAKGDVSGGVSVGMVLTIDQYTPEHVRKAVLDGLKYNGYQGFMSALRQSPVVGSLEAAGEKFNIRWAHQEPAGDGRGITVVTDQPVFFLGLGRAGAKPTTGYQVGVLRLDLDAAGRGGGIMAAAARVKPSGVSGVRIDDYAETPLKITVERPAP